MSLHFGHVLCSRLYGLAWRLSKPFLRRNRRLADGFARRLVPDDWARPADVWLQAASGGEAYLVWELLQNLPPQPAPLRVLATTWTRQGLEVLQGMSAKLKETRDDLDIEVTLFPLDHPRLMYRATGMVRPRVVVLLETELWPGLLFACTRRRIPVLVLNGRLSVRSVRNYAILDRLTPDFWNTAGPAAVSAVSEVDARRFRSILPPERVSTAPNIKFDRALVATPTPEDLAPLAALLPAPSASSIALLASVRQEEEAEIATVAKALHTRHPQSVVIVAPRHMHRVPAWRLLLGETVRLRSALTPENPARPGDCVIWDTFGELAKLYALAPAVFIGGSLAPLGGQNFLEPLACGRIPRVGPHLDNFLWALDADAGADSLDNQLLVLRCGTADQLTASLSEALQNPADADTVRRRFAGWLRTRQGGAAQSAALLQHWLEKNHTTTPDSSTQPPHGDNHGNQA